MSSFDQFLLHRLRILKYWPFPTYLPIGGHTSTVSQKNVTVINIANVTHRVEFRSIFHAPYQNFKIQAIPNVLAHGRSYEHSFTKKYDGHKR
ncbi:hypothetical protein BHE74_00017072 [Ensete ventricosum]|nr:hypothetical protein BHE74_00017072 [Ensete ventricosum]